MLERAQDAGYEFVQRGETKVNSTSIGSNALVSGNTDMGSNVSVVAGKELLPDGQGVRLVLMKIKEEYYLEDKNAADVKSSKQIDTLMGGKLGQEKHDGSNTVYVKPGNAIPAMFKPKKPIKF